MDYPNRTRLKIFAHAEFLAPDADPALTELVTVPGYRGKVERVFRLTLDAFDWNCPQHITPRFTEMELAEDHAPGARALDHSRNRKRRAACAPRLPWRNAMTTDRPPLPPFDLESATQKVRLAEDGWNSRDRSAWRSHLRRAAAGATAPNS